MLCKVKKWGNSLGVVIPKQKANELGIRPEDTIIIRIEKENPLKELYGAFPELRDWKKILRETRKEMESKYL